MAFLADEARPPWLTSVTGEFTKQSSAQAATVDIATEPTASLG